MSRRAVVLEVEEKNAVLLLDGGEIRRLPLRGQSLIRGQEVWVPDAGPVLLRTTWRRAAATAAAVLIVGGGYWLLRGSTPPVAAWVSVDINPSINLGVSAGGRVVQVEGLDKAGRRIVASLPGLRGKSLAAAVLAVTQAAREDGYLGHTKAGGSYIVLAGAPATPVERPLVQREMRLAESSLESLARSVGSTLVALPTGGPGAIREAASYHLSVGRYLLGKLTGEPWTRIADEPLSQILSRWPVVKLSSSSTPPSSSASGSASSPTGSETPSGTSSFTSSSVPGAPSSSSAAMTTTSVTGTLTGLTNDSVIVDGSLYPVSLNAALIVNGVRSPLSLAIVMQLENQRVILTIQNGTVVRLSATVPFTRNTPLPITPPPTANPSAVAR